MANESDGPQRDQAGVGPDPESARNHELVPLEQLSGYSIRAGDPDIRGWNVRTESGRDIGEVDGLLVDKDQGEVIMVEVEMREGGVHAEVPIRAVQLDREHRTVVVESADLSRDRTVVVEEAEIDPRRGTVKVAGAAFTAGAAGSARAGRKATLQKDIRTSARSDAREAGTDASRSGSSGSSTFRSDAARSEEFRSAPSRVEPSRSEPSRSSESLRSSESVRSSEPARSSESLRSAELSRSTEVSRSPGSRNIETSRSVEASRSVESSRPPRSFSDAADERSSSSMGAGGSFPSERSAPREDPQRRLGAEESMQRRPGADDDSARRPSDDGQ